MKKAFTLAEVLITLGIIGVVAALTLPNLIANYKKRVVVTRMQKFYSSINQASKLAIVENDEKIWDDIAFSPTDTDTGNKTFAWYNKYLKKHIISNEIIQTPDGLLIANSDGSGFGMYGVHIFFCPVYTYCKAQLNKSNNSTYNLFVSGMDGKNIFGFFAKGTDVSAYDICWNGERETLFTNTASTCSFGSDYGCSQNSHKYCAQLIQYDGWKISDDYPVKF